MRALCDTESLLRMLSASLRSVHVLDPAACPFDRSTRLLVQVARDRVAGDDVDPGRFDAAYRRFGPAELLDYVERGASRHLDHPDAVILGDARLASFWMQASGDQVVAGAVDLIGVGDPYRDLATISIDLVGGGAMPEVLGRFYELYGLPSPEVARLDFHVLLDQLLR